MHAARDPSVKNKTLHHLKVFTSAWMFRLVFVNHQGHFISSVMHLSSFCTISYQYHTPGTSFLFFLLSFFFTSIVKRPSYPPYGEIGAVKRCPSMASKANICGKCYESDSSGKKPDKRRVEDEWSLETLHLSYAVLSDVSIVVLQKPESCVCFWSAPQRPLP